LTSNAEEVARAERVVFPGQGAIAGCMTALDTCHLRAPCSRRADQAVSRHLPRVAALYDFSEEAAA